MLDQTKNHTRYMLRGLIKYGKPYILTGEYQKHKYENERITFINIHPYIPGKPVKNTCSLFDHVHVFTDNLQRTCPEWRQKLQDGVRYCLICYSKPYRGGNNEQRCGIVLTLNAGMSPVMDMEYLNEELTVYAPFIERICVDWNEYMHGRWLKENEPVLYSASQFVQDNNRHKNKVLRKKEEDKKRRQRSQSIWRVINLKVS